MAGTITLVSDERGSFGFSTLRHYRKITVSWVGDATDGSVPTLSIPLYGHVAKIIFNPGSPAPTNGHNFRILSNEDSAMDEMGAQINSTLSSGTTQVFYPTQNAAPTSRMQTFLAGTYGLSITGNIVASAQGRFIIYMIDGYGKMLCK